MKICKVCLQSDMLCGACSKKVESGQVKQIDIKLSRVLNKVNKEKSFDMDFIHAIEDGSRLFVVVESKHAARFIGSGGRNIKELSKLLGKQVKLLEKAEGSDKHVIEKLIGAPVLGINKLYSNGESYKVRVESRYIKSVQPLSNVVGMMIGKKVSFVFE